MKYDFLNTYSYKNWRDSYLSGSDPLNGGSNESNRVDHSKPLVNRKYGENSDIFTIPAEAKTISSENINGQSNPNAFSFLNNDNQYSFDSKSFLQGNGSNPGDVTAQTPKTSSYDRGFGNKNQDPFASMYKYQDVDQNSEMLSQGAEMAEGAGNSSGTDWGSAAGSVAGFVGSQVNMWSTDHGDSSEGEHFMKNLQSGGEGAQTGASIGGGIGAIVGAVIGLGSGIWDSVVDNRKAQKRKRKEYFGNIERLETERERMDKLNEQEADLLKLEKLKKAQLGYLQNEHNYG